MTANVQPDDLAMIRCDITGAEQKARATKTGLIMLPRGWRRWGGKVWSDKAWQSHFRPIVVTVGVAKPLEGTWAELAQAVDFMRRRCADVANWHMSQLFTHEEQAVRRDGKLPPFPSGFSEYQRCAAIAPDMPKASMCEAMRIASAKYRALRGKLLLARSVSLPSFRTLPVLLKGETVKLTSLAIGPEQRLVLEARIKDQRWKLLLAARRGDQRGLRVLQRVSAGELESGTVQLDWRFAGNGSQQARTAAGGGEKRRRSLVARLVVFVERRPRNPQAADVLAVSTQTDGLLAATLGSDPEKVWFFNAQHLPRRVAAHAERNQKMSEDRKAERRMPRRRGIQMNDHGDRYCRKHADFIRTLIQQCARSLVNYALRRRVAKIFYDDSVRTYVQSFPYFALCERIAQVCELEGVLFEKAGAPAPTPDDRESEIGGDDANE